MRVSTQTCLPSGVYTHSRVEAHQAIALVTPQVVLKHMGVEDVTQGLHHVLHHACVVAKR